MKWGTMMIIHTSAARAGQVLAADLFGRTNHPMIRKNTVLTAEHLDILSLFMIKEIEILSDTSDKKQAADPNSQKSQLTPDNPSKMHSHFLTLYKEAVKQYKVLFTNWEAGAPIDALSLRKAIVHVVEKGMDHPGEISNMQQITNRDDYLAYHAVSLAVLSAFIARRLGYPRGECLQIGMAGALCDCGMSRISPAILKKKGPLNPQELKEMKQHSIHGYNLLKKLPAIKEGVLLGVLQHHEREDGSGYPLKVPGSKLHPYSRILAVADVYLAMTSERSYRTKLSPFKVIELMMKDQFGQFDPGIIRVITDGLTIFSAGSKVRLSNGQIGLIVFKEDSYPTRPIVQLHQSEDIISLMERKDLYIEETLYY
ncbi:HD-GYP domain-containing protein [Fictibacillus terranigra]|uniref:HD-GYP domain-containing protein n=1 Tax=Fictibacillus terranigra TaxID=3058424 RepID=A0ABT8E0I3_9BACL|nr:HD-GYP domain-containing protein [Fictibacillus sp. CENA-BCM004]MDN4071415.1 HD-GYP domain-containing protein [Fictibacillus sp. CENA-BCM004]